ncbi:hypothetical protein FT663_05322 [Candidozyma haemuli var. vulneris]|nr:hypothetical protein FT663_05322 [[Candida] haemuloni var. vulneris]KAF3988021.1 hypothetical protein FT662_03674 [[Candida] haemuloni var. vulneris]
MNLPEPEYDSNRHRSSATITSGFVAPGDITNYSTMAVASKLNQLSIRLLEGRIERRAPTESKCPVGIFLLSPEGTQALVSGNLLRSCVDFIELCEEEWDITECYIMVPKQVSEAQPVVKFLNRSLDMAFVDERKSIPQLDGFDTLDWYVCKCDL